MEAMKRTRAAGNTKLVLHLQGSLDHNSFHKQFVVVIPKVDDLLSNDTLDNTLAANVRTIPLVVSH